jgi:hypothetical protein
LEFLQHKHSDCFIVRSGDSGGHGFGNNLRNDFVVNVMRFHQSAGSNYRERNNTTTYRVLFDGRLAGHTASGEQRDGLRPERKLD